MTVVSKKINILLWNRYGDQMYLVESEQYSLTETLDIISYIQIKNNEVCSSFELSVFEIGKLMVECFGFKMQDVNYDEMTREQRKYALGTVKKLKYSCKVNKQPDARAYMIELTDFWELYNQQSTPKEVLEHGKKIEEKIKATVRNNPNSRPWL